ncbi:MAG: HEAT repeat domain-containing protein [Phycisphaeraceae bacterium]|nr:HEAT repeat domain-containing protein [Phycisphaeraceae bacterium]
MAMSKVMVFLFTAMIVSEIGQTPAAQGRSLIPEWKRTIPAAADRENVAVYFSNGDNEIFFNVPPIDSPESIDEVLDVLKQAYGVKRIYWRAAQIEQIIYKGVNREESAHHGPWSKWMDHLFSELGTGDHMIRAAKARGMEVWGVAALFDHGAQAYIEYPTKGQGPFFFESKIRVEHPEWIPVDRAGIRRMSGPICFAYPEARQAMVAMYADLVRDKGYDGLSFHLYVENQGTRFDDEFGFNEPIVEAYQDSYGVNIRTEPYDKQKLADLRGEYLTQFFRELREALRPLGVKISVMLSAKHPDLPQSWLAFKDVLLSGRIRVDWRTYAREGLVDELFVYFHGDPIPTLRLVKEEVGETDIQLATIASAGFSESAHDLRDAGVWRTISGQSEELEYGYHSAQPVEALDGDDFVAKLSVLSQMGAGSTPLDLNRVVHATHDSSILVRRQALRLLVTAGLQSPDTIDQKVIDAIKDRLDDAQNIVRCTAVNTLAQLGDSSTIPVLYDAIARHANPMMHLMSAAPLGSLPPERTSDLILGLNHPSADARIVAIRLVGGGKARPDAWPALIANADHENWLVRWNVARALEHIATPESTDCLARLLDDPHPTVRSMATRNLSLRLHSDTRWVGGMGYEVIDKLAARFGEYGQSSTRDDADWGWRTIGEALDRLGPRGHEALEHYLNQNEDAVLADRAWRVLYVKQEAHQPVTITEEEAEAGYREYPLHRSASTLSPVMPVAESEPALMPYMVQDFNSETASENSVTAGNPISDEGGWRDVILVDDPRTTSGKCVRIMRDQEKGVGFGFRRDYRLCGGQLKISFSVLLEQPQSGLTVWLTDSGKWQGNLRLQLGPAGQMLLFNGEGRSIPVGAGFAPGVWHRFELNADLDRRRFTLYAITPAGKQTLAGNAALAQVEQINAFVLLPAGESGCAGLIDDIDWQVTNPAAKGDRSS